MGVDVVPVEIRRALERAAIACAVQYWTRGDHRDRACVTKCVVVRARRECEGAIVVCSLAERLNLLAIARAFAWKKACLASPLEIHQLVGRGPDEISPVTNVSVPVLIDTPLLQMGRVLVETGLRGLYLEMSPADLLRLTQATTAAITLPRFRWE